MFDGRQVMSKLEPLSKFLKAKRKGKERWRKQSYSMAAKSFYKLEPRSNFRKKKEKIKRDGENR
jgi:hypothetical protein